MARTSEALALPEIHARYALTRLKGSTSECLALAREAILLSVDGERALAKAKKEVTGSESALGVPTITVPASFGKSNLRAMTWVPGSLKAQGYMPDSPASLGKPWIWASKIGQTRSGPSAWPAWGIGQFWFGLEGLTLVVIFEQTHLGQLGIPQECLLDRLEDMNPQDFASFLAVGKVQLCQLTPQSALWLPYGHLALAIGLPDTVSAGAFLPFFNQGLATLYSPGFQPFSAALRAFLATDTKVANQWAPVCRPVLDWQKALEEDGSGAFNSASGSAEKPAMGLSPRPNSAAASAPQATDGRTGGAGHGFPSQSTAGTAASPLASWLDDSTPPAKRARHASQAPQSQPPATLALPKPKAKGKGKAGKAKAKAKARASVAASLGDHFAAAPMGDSADLS